MKLFKTSFIVCILLGLFSCKQSHTLFEPVSSSHSGIKFNNQIIEKDSINPIDLTNIYNGGGVGIGDFNNDGLQDIYFTGNQVSNKLYLNKGDFRFEDITDLANVSGEGKWSRGVSIVDINNDGLKDIYVSATIIPDPEKRKNILYVNQGMDKAGIPHFKDMAAEYGLDDTTHTTMTTFFDYDNDGDLDAYVVVNEIINSTSPSVYRPKITDGSSVTTGRLYRNDWDSSKGHPFFRDVSKEAGITIEGYGHSATISDFNLDGWKDIFVTNDFISNDILYINNHDGTFTDKASTYFRHTSANGMGQDVIDINNDGLSDVIELDMNPEDNYRKKMMLSAGNYQTYLNSDHFGYQYQYVRNTLQLNQGKRINEQDSLGDPVFSDIGFFTGLSETDWSWTPLVTDFDNDGYRDVIITNGYPRDVTDHDFISFRNQAFNVASPDYILSQIPKVKIHNYAYRNNGNATFTNVTEPWGLNVPTFSNGGAYVDLDNDGDMDFIVNNINDEASLYRNTLNDKNPSAQHYISFILKGDQKNIDGQGAWIEIYYGGQIQAYEQTPYRGYLSSIDFRPHFGLGATDQIDSVVIKWPNRMKQVLQNVKANQILTLDIKNANQPYNWNEDVVASGSLFKEVTNQLGAKFEHKEKDYIDFNIQKLLPHKFSEYGPGLAVGDLNGDGLDDLVAGGSDELLTTLLIQQKNGTFSQKPISTKDKLFPGKADDQGIALFDADGDGDLDIYIAVGGYENPTNSPAYRDRFYINNGKGDFTEDTVAIPANLTSNSCVRVADFDKDGDLDLFVAGRVDPQFYPKPVSSHIYRNDSKNGVPKFTDITNTNASDLINIGLVCDAVWTDFDGDGWQDLILAGEWMPITFIKNEKGNFRNVSATTGVNDKKGWWTSITAGDFDNDGDIDYILGNLGLNSYFRASDQHPITIYAKDFDNNGSYDAIPTIYLKTSQEDSTWKEVPVHTRDELIRQMISFRAKFQSYKSFANASFDQMFSKDDLKDAIKLQANYLDNSYLRNDGKGLFTLTSLPLNTQYSCMNGMVAEDFDGDGNLDLLLVGNDYGTDVFVGRYDACNGLFMKGDGKGDFSSTTIQQSGWYIPGNAKALVKLRGTNHTLLLAASRNKSGMKVFEVKRNIQTIPLNPLDVSATVKYKNGSSQIREFQYGSSFLSQSGRFINIDSSISSITIFDSKGNKREITL